MLTKDELYNLALNAENKKVVVVCPYDDATIESCIEAYDKKMCDLIFVGEEKRILDAIKIDEIEKRNIQLVHVTDDNEAIVNAAKLLSDKKADVIMKGLIDTSLFLKGILKNGELVDKGSVLSHVGMLFKENEKTLMVTDAAINIFPDLEQKKQLIINAVKAANALGVEKPLVANICAKEKVYEKMPSTIDADKLREMNKKGEIENCIVSGPLQLDVAVSPKACDVKGIKDEVCGKADILLCDSIEPANALVKSMKYLGGYLFSGIVVGANIPIVLTSRADDFEEKLLAIVIACSVVS